MKADTPIIFSDISCISINGKDVLPFTNNLLISDLYKLEDNDVIYSVFCNPKGRIIYSVFIHKMNQQLLLFIDQSLAKSALQYLKMRQFRSQVEIQFSDYYLTLTENEQPITENEQPITKNRFPMLFGLRKPGSEKVLSIYDWLIPTLYPWIDINTSEKYIPQHLGLDQLSVIDFDKGCYPGQEVVARLHYLGKIKKQLQLLKYHSKNKISHGKKIKVDSIESSIDIISPSIKQSDHFVCQCVSPTGTLMPILNL